MPADALSDDLLAHIFRLLLDQAGRGDYQQPLRYETPRLKQALTLACVCTSWRRAAVQATASITAEVRPMRELLPVYLSPLLGQLVRGCRSIHLGFSLLCSSNAPAFLQHAQAAALSTWGTQEESGFVEAIMAQCPTISQLACEGDLLPLNLSHSLQSFSIILTVYQSSQDSRLLLAGLRRLPRLAQLSLELDASLNELLRDETMFQGFPALSLLTLVLRKVPAPAGFRALGHAAEQGVHVQLHVRYIDTAPSAIDRGFWQVLADIRLLALLKLRDLYVSETPASTAAQVPPVSISCRELSLSFQHATEQSPGQLQACDLLPALSCPLLYCHFFKVRSGYSLPWNVLVSRPAVYLLQAVPHVSLPITGCPGRLPDCAEGAWALVLLTPELGNVHGLPLHLCERGPRSYRVWRNNAVSDAMLDRAFDVLL